MASAVEKTVASLPSKISSSSRKRFNDRSNMVTSAPIPIAILAAFNPTTPPPITTTFPGATPGTPPNKVPLPPCAFSK